MKFYLFGTLRTRFLMQLVLLAGFFVSVSAVRADLITFQFEGELTNVDTPLEGEFSVGDSFGGTYTFESNTEPVVIIDDGDGYGELFPNTIQTLDFSSGSYVATAESGDITYYNFDFLYYGAEFNSVDGFSVGGYIPQDMKLFIDDEDTFLNFSSNSIYPEYNANDYDSPGGMSLTHLRD